MSEHKTRPGMMALYIRNFDKELHKQIKVLAAWHGKSVEETFNDVARAGLERLMPNAAKKAEVLSGEGGEGI